MARKPKQTPLAEDQEVKVEIKEQLDFKFSYIVTKDIEGSINYKKYSAKAGEKVMFDKSEALLFRDFIKEA